MAYVKTIQDYYDLIYSKYPTLPKEDVRRALQFGFKSLYLTNSYGADVLIHRNNFWLYSGQLMNNSLHYFNYYKRKIRIKLRIMYKRKKIKWDGYYYFALSRDQYDNYLKQKNKKGRPRKNFKYGNVILYKYFDECNLRNSGALAIFKIESPLDLGLSLYKTNFKSDKAQLVLERDPLTFKDILASNYKYQYVTDYVKWKKTKKNG